ncbi:hypothetical protein GLUCORHAEAF1_13730 [Komagataeibacter rhaeticus AF1]|nr:hypothetical protein GLUCORHAEAF1_13730 [Komagataeibacter rhaeticus AF1]
MSMRKMIQAALSMGLQSRRHSFLDRSYPIALRLGLILMLIISAFWIVKLIQKTHWNYIVRWGLWKKFFCLDIISSSI